MVGNIIMSVDSMIASTLLQFSVCEVISFVSSNNVWNILMVYKEFCEFTGGCFKKYYMYER